MIALKTAEPKAQSTGTVRKDVEFLRMVAPYRQPHAAKSIWQLSSTLVAFVACWLLMLWSLQYPYYVTLLLSLPAALLIVRLFIIQHDCGHRSFFRSKSVNDTVGFLLGMITWTPYHCWRTQHAVHHASSGDLDRRGRGGEIFTMTVDEYKNASGWKRFGYRLYRNPLVLLIIAPFWYFVIEQRLTLGVPRTWKKERASVHYTNLGLLLVSAAVMSLVGWRAFLIIHPPIVILGGSIGVWMFYVQHQYEDTYWRHREDWSYVDAALHGSSYYRLPKIFQWFTANIGLHHVHHLDSRIPNYLLQQCHDQNPGLHCVRTISAWESLSCLSYKLWDEDQRQMVGFP